MRKHYPAQPMDLVQATYMRAQNPIILCRLRLDAAPDARRLTQAVAVTARIVPEVLCGYNAAKNRFEEAGRQPRDMLHIFTKPPAPAHWDVDIAAGPQLKILLHTDDTGTDLIFCASHMLCDAAGFLQYLYLLCRCYNHPAAPVHTPNLRGLWAVLKRTRPLRANKVPPVAAVPVPPLLPAQDGPYAHRLLQHSIPKHTFARLHQKTRAAGATLNDVFLAAYARVVAQAAGTTRVGLPCPADLRRYLPGQKALTVANLTGQYTLVVDVSPADTFDDTLARVHTFIAGQKARAAALGHSGLLYGLSPFLPVKALAAIVAKGISVEAVSYTNLGQIDASRLRFSGCSIRSCVLAGSWKKAPLFQLCVSSWRGGCILSAATISSPAGQAAAAALLRATAAELSAWAGPA